MLPSEETMLMTARILSGNMTAQIERQHGHHNSLVPASTASTKEILSGVNLSYEQTKLVVTARVTWSQATTTVKCQ